MVEKRFGSRTTAAKPDRGDARGSLTCDRSPQASSQCQSGVAPNVFWGKCRNNRQARFECVRFSSSARSPPQWWAAPLLLRQVSSTRPFDRRRHACLRYGQGKLRPAGTRLPKPRSTYARAVLQRRWATALRAEEMRHRACEIKAIAAGSRVRTATDGAARRRPHAQRATRAVNRKLGSKPSSRRALSVDRYPLGSAML